MNIFKKILLAAFSIFLVYRTYELVQFLLDRKEASLSITLLLGISFILNLFITGIFAFLGFAFPTNRVLPNSYYNVKNPILLNKTYNLLGIKHFRKILLLAFWGKRKNKKKFFNGNRNGLNNLIFQTKQAEFGHLAAFVVILIVSTLLLANGYFMVFLITNIINFIGNVYPIVLQRKHRFRVAKLKSYNRGSDTKK